MTRQIAAGLLSFLALALVGAGIVGALAHNPLVALLSPVLGYVVWFYGARRLGEGAYGAQDDGDDEDEPQAHTPAAPQRPAAPSPASSSTPHPPVPLEDLLRPSALDLVPLAGSPFVVAFTSSGVLVVAQTPTTPAELLECARVTAQILETREIMPVLVDPARLAEPAMEDRVLACSPTQLGKFSLKGTLTSAQAAAYVRVLAEL